MARARLSPLGKYVSACTGYKPITVEGVAAKAGISVSAARRAVVHGHPPVSPSTVVRIIRAYADGLSAHLQEEGWLAAYARHPELTKRAGADS